MQVKRLRKGIKKAILKSFPNKSKLPLKKFQVRKNFFPYLKLFFS